MLIAAHADGHVAVTQPAHAWVSGQLARAWGGDLFGPLVPVEEVCLAAEQHDVGMAGWDRDPTLDPSTGLPTTFMQMDLPTHLALWSEGPERVLGQSRYAALLVSMHGSALYAGRDLAAMGVADRERVRSFLERRRAFEARVRATLPADDAELARNQRLLWTWDGLSLALLLGWAPWTAEAVPAANGQRLDLHLRARGAEHVLDPWPFAAERLTVRTQGRVLEQRAGTAEQLRQTLAQARWVDLTYELAPA
jgi:hypothetical protein